MVWGEPVKHPTLHEQTRTEGSDAPCRDTHSALPHHGKRDKMTDRFTIQPSSEPGFWVATDTKHGIVIEFQEHRFKETQKVTILEGEEYRANDDGTDMPTYVSRMVRFLNKHHYALLGESVQDRRAEIGERIRQLREKRGYSQGELGNMVGLALSGIRSIEVGRYATTLDILNKIADALGVKLDFVEYGEEK